ncbi:MAG: ATP synthase A1 subunit C [Thermoplasmatota archaeon]
MVKLASLRWKIFRGNYAYVAARVRAKKPKLIPAEEYPKLLAMTPAEIARYLEEGEYKKEILELAQKYSGAMLVDMATRLNLARTFREIQKMSQGELEKMVALYLQRWDVYNVKTILRGRFSNTPDEEIARNLIPAGALSTEDLDDLLRLGNIGEVIESLAKTSYGDALKDAGATASPERLTEIENALDRRYYELLVQSVPVGSEANRALLNLIRHEIDVVNLKMVLRLRAAGVEDAGNLLLPGGREFDVDRSRRLLRAGNDEFAGEIENSAMKDALPAIRASLEKGDLNAAVTALDRWLTERASSFSHRYPLSVLPVIDYVRRKRAEVDNLRIIAVSKARNVREAKIEELILR